MGKSEADDVMLKKKVEQEDVPLLDRMIISSRNKPLTMEEISAFGKAGKKSDVGLVVRHWATVKTLDDGRKKQRPVVFIGIQGTF